MASSVSTNVTDHADPSDEVIIPWTSIAWFGVLLVLPFLSILTGMVHDWLTIEEMGHGIFVPFVAGYVIWVNRRKVFAPPIRRSWWGFPFVVWGFLQSVLGTVGADYFLSRTGFFVALVGVIWMMCGFDVLRRLAFPLFLLLFTIRIPLFIYSRITFPLQILASKLAAGGLSLMGIPVLREGNVLELASQRLDVVEACSGIRSLISLSFLALVYGWFFDRKTWMRWVLLAASIPIAIVANSGRIVVTGLLSEINKEFAAGAYHSFEGWVIFMVDLFILIGVHTILNKGYAIYHARRIRHAG
jgi:exosortase